MSSSVSSLQTDSKPLILGPRDPFSEIGADASLKVLSFLDYPSLPVFFSVCKNTQALQERNNQQFERSLFSRVHIFDRAHWQDYYGATITDQFEPREIDIRILRAFLKTYYGPNPTIPGPVRIAVKDSCLMPTVVPRSMTIAGKNEMHCLQILGELAEHPLKGGYAAKYGCFDSKAFALHGMTEARKASLVLLLRGVVARNKVWSCESHNPDERGQVQFLEELNANTGYACETEPDALSQNTVLFAHHAVTGEYPFGKSNGMERRLTFGQTRELVSLSQHIACRLISGGFDKKPSGPARLDVTFMFPNKHTGVGVLRKFEGL